MRKHLNCTACSGWISCSTHLSIRRSEDRGNRHRRASPDHRGRLRRHGIRQPAKRHRWTHRLVSKPHRMCDLRATLIQARFGVRVVPHKRPRRVHLGGALGASAFLHSLHQEGMVSKPAAVGAKAIINRVERLPVENVSACGVADLRINDQWRHSGNTPPLLPFSG